jgi:putative flippase GtrA
LLVGVANTVFGYVVYATLLTFMGYKPAYTASFVLSVLFSYWLNSRFVFGVSLSIKGLLRFPIVYLVQYLLGIVLMFVMVEKVGVSAYFSPLIVIVATIPVTFVLSRTLLRGAGNNR